jgi:hypothetical protein
VVAVLYSVLWIVAVCLFADIRHWRKYYDSMQFSALANALYDLICYLYPLWQLEANGLPNRTLPTMLLILLGMPLSTFVYLSNYPYGQSMLKKAGYVLLFVAIFDILEFISLQTGAISYHNGWSLWCSTVFTLAIFLYIRLHYSKPLYAIGLSVPFALFLMWMFDVSLDKMK